MTMTRSRLCIARVLPLMLVLGSAADVASAAEPGTKNETRKPAPPMKPGPDGWYDAVAPDASFEIRMPGVYRGFADETKTDAGVVTSTVGVRTNLAAAFGASTTYVASCTRQQGDARSAKERLQTVIDGWESRGTMQYRKPLESAKQPGIEFEMADDVKVLRVRVFAPAAGTCTLLVTWRAPATPSEAEFEKFFGSFRIARR